MKRSAVLILTLALMSLLTACGGGDVPTQTAQLTPSPSNTAPEGLPTAEELPEACRLYVSEANLGGAAERFADKKLPLAERAYDGVGESFTIHMADGSEAELVLEGAIGEGISLTDFAAGLTQQGGYGRIAWNGELYNALSLRAENCTVPNLWPNDGGLLCLDIQGDCTLDGGACACLEGFSCVLITGEGTLTVTGQWGGSLACGGGDFPLPALMVDGDVTVICGSLELQPNQGAAGPTLALLNGTVLTDWVQGGDVLNAGGTLLVRRADGADLILRDGVTLLDEMNGEGLSVVLSGGTGYLVGPLPQGTAVESGAGTFVAGELSGVTVRGSGAVVSAGAETGTAYCSTTYSADWAAGSGLAWDWATVRAAEGRYFAGVLGLTNAQAPELLAWGSLWVELTGESAVTGDIAGTSILLTGPGTLTADRLNVWGWGGIKEPLLAVTDGAAVTLTAEEGIALGCEGDGSGLLLVDGGAALTCEGGLWIGGGTLSVRDGTLTVGGPCSVERGRVEITGGTVTLAEGLWLGEGDIVITGGTVIVPGGSEGLIAEHGTVIVEGGTIREP